MSTKRGMMAEASSPQRTSLSKKVYYTSLKKHLVGGYYWIVYSDEIIMKTIDNLLRQGKLASSLSNNTVIGNKNPWIK